MKPTIDGGIVQSRSKFLYIDPLKQGLKQNSSMIEELVKYRFLYIDPLKQGLKPEQTIEPIDKMTVFIHRSIKTRIETWSIYNISRSSVNGFYT